MNGVGFMGNGNSESNSNSNSNINSKSPSIPLLQRGRCFPPFAKGGQGGFALGFDGESP